MNRFRDFIYNTSDILVTLVIIIIALAVISWRVSSIMSYGSPDEDASGGEVQGGIVSHTVDEDADSDADEETADDQDGQDQDAASDEQDGAADADAGQDAAAQDQTAAAQTQTASSYSFTVSSNQSAESIGAALVSAGLISDKQAFLSAVTASGAETRLKAGTFTIPAGATPEQIVAVLTS